jgi:hypothetical protein
MTKEFLHIPLNTRSAPTLALEKKNMIIMHQTVDNPPLRPPPS